MKSSDKTYSGIWLTPVTLADWNAKKETIPEKLKYFNEELAKAGDNKSWAEWQQKLIDDVKDFDKQGQIYQTYIDKMSALKLKRQSINKQMVDLGLVENTAFSEERKANAWRFTSPAEADKHFRDVSGEVWRRATSAERSGIFGYTPRQMYTKTITTRCMLYWNYTRSRVTISSSRIPKSGPARRTNTCKEYHGH